MQEAEFEQAVDRYGDMVFRLALSYLKNRADAEDIMQETLLKLYTQSRKVPFASLEHERFWVVRVAVNECKKAAALTLAPEDRLSGRTGTVGGL